MTKVLPEPVEPIKKLQNIFLTPIRKGTIKGVPIAAESLWKDGPVAIFIARRAACRISRLDAKELSTLFQKQFQHVRLVCIIKEIAVEGGKFTDNEMGVEELRVKFLHGCEMFLDTDRKFYEYFGNKSAIYQPYSKSPCALYSDYQRLQHRIKEAQIDKCNYSAGETFLKGGVLLIGPNEGIVYQYPEMTGSPLPLEDIEQAVWNLIVKYPLPTHQASLKTFVNNIEEYSS